MSKKKNKQRPSKRNPIQQMHIEQNRKAGAHKDRKKEQNKKACRGDTMTDKEFLEQLREIMEINALADWVANDPWEEFEELRDMIDKHLKRT